MKTSCISCGNELNVEFQIKTKHMVTQIIIYVVCDECGARVPITISPKAKKVKKQEQIDFAKDSGYMG